MRMLSAVEKRRTTMRNMRSREEAERKLGIFREQFDARCGGFGSAIDGDQEALTSSLAARGEPEELAVDNIALLAAEVLQDFETSDASRHWKSRRHQNWGFMYNVQLRIANAIFPAVSKELTAKEALFQTFIKRFQVHVEALSKEGEAICEAIGVSSDFSLDIGSDLKKFLENNLQENCRTS